MGTYDHFIFVFLLSSLTTFHTDLASCTVMYGSCFCSFYYVLIMVLLSIQGVELFMSFSFGFKNFILDLDKKTSLYIWCVDGILPNQRVGSTKIVTEDGVINSYFLNTLVSLKTCGHFLFCRRGHKPFILASDSCVSSLNICFVHILFG